MQLVYGGKDQAGRRWWRVQLSEGSSEPIVTGKIWEPQFNFYPEDQVMLTEEQCREVADFCVLLKQRFAKEFVECKFGQQMIERAMAR
jgi:hypothetical protein